MPSESFKRLEDIFSPSLPQVSLRFLLEWLFWQPFFWQAYY